MEKINVLVATLACAAGLILCRQAIAETSDAALSVSVYPTYYEIDSQRFDSLDALEEFAKSIISERFTVIVEECIAYPRGVELHRKLTQLTYEYVLELKESEETVRSLQFQSWLTGPDQCVAGWSQMNDGVTTIGAFYDETPSEMALMTSTDSTCPVPSEFVQDVAEEVLRSQGIEPVSGPALPDWYGVQVQLRCQHDRHISVTVSFVDSKDDESIEYGHVASGERDYSNDRWSFLFEFSRYQTHVNGHLTRTMRKFLEYNSNHFWYSCDASGGCSAGHKSVSD